jgi:hypothetical protein
MVICVKSLLSLDISVKYAQCVKMWLFLKCVCSFLKSCVQFLVKCVQFPKVLCSFSGEAKERCAYRTRVTHLSKGRRIPTERVSRILVKGDALWRHISPLLKYVKKNTYMLLFVGFSLHQHEA